MVGIIIILIEFVLGFIISLIINLVQFVKNRELKNKLKKYEEGAYK